MTTKKESTMTTEESTTGHDGGLPAERDVTTDLLNGRIDYWMDRAAAAERRLGAVAALVDEWEIRAAAFKGNSAGTAYLNAVSMTRAVLAPVSGAVEGVNPHLPAATDDGQHVYQRGPADIGGNRRCLLCGAYRGSVESERTCQGQYTESAKMRVWADDKWKAESTPVAVHEQEVRAGWEAEVLKAFLNNPPASDEACRYIPDFISSLTKTMIAARTSGVTA